MDNRPKNTEKKGEILIGYAGIIGCAFGSVLILPKAKECPAKGSYAEPEREYTYKDYDELDGYYDSL
mgnify:CR=1 FL=1